MKSPSSKLPCCVSVLSARCDLMLLQSSKTGAVPRRRSCSSTSSQAVAVNSPSSELLCYVSVLSARYNLMLLHSSKAEAVPRLLQHQQPSRCRDFVAAATADVSAPPARCDVTVAAGQQGRSSAYLAVAPAHGFVVVVFAVVAVAVNADARSPVCAHNQFAADAAQQETAPTSPPLLHKASSPSPLLSSPPMQTRAVLCAR